jgi:hypothetical protein
MLESGRHRVGIATYGSKHDRARLDGAILPGVSGTARTVVIVIGVMVAIVLCRPDPCRCAARTAAARSGADSAVVRGSVKLTHSHDGEADWRTDVLLVELTVWG